MKIEAPLLTLGADPEPTFTDGGLMVKLRLAENHNKNVGTRENPEWEQVGTSWYQFVAYGEVAEEILNTLEKGSGIRLVRGYHRKRKLKDDKIVDNYVINEFEKYERK